MRWARHVAGCLLIASLAACARDAEKPTAAGRESAPPTAAPRVAAVPYEQIGPIEEIWPVIEGYRKVIIRIAIAVGYTQEQIHETLRQVAEATSREEDADEVLVFAYRSMDDVSSPYNVARAAYDRDWKRGVGFEPMPFVVDLDPGYLTAQQVPPSSGACTAPGVTVVRESYGDKWPFPKHASAILDCEIREFRGTLRPFDIIELDGVRYGFNRTAVEVGGFPDVGPFIRNPEPPGNSEVGVFLDLREKINTVCDTRL